MPKLETSAECRVKIDNEEIKHTVSSVRLEQCIDGHHVLQVGIRGGAQATGGAKLEDPSQFTGFLGKTISVTIQPVGDVVDPSLTMQFVGIVTEVRLDNSVDEFNCVTIVGRSPTIALEGAKRNSFHHEETGSSIVEAVLREHQITVGSVESTKKALEFSVQYRESDYEYVMRIASESGLFAFYDGRQFYAVKASSDTAAEVTFRETLGVFSMGLGTAISDYLTQAWDQANKQSLEGDVTGTPKGSSPSELSSISLKASSTVFAKPGFTAAVKAPDMASVDAVLARAKESSVGRMVRCRGESIVPAVAVGHCVKISGMDKLDGLYWVQTVTHVFDESGKYHNTFTCTPLDVAFPPAIAPGPPITDLQSAVVVDNNDPEKLGRVKVKFPWQGSDETPWIRVMTPQAGAERGWYGIPEIDDEVLIGFEHGDPDLPLVLGSLYSGKDAPHGDTGGEDNLVKLYMTKGGNQICFTDKEGAEEIRIAQKDGKNTIVVTLDGPAISIESQGDITIKGATISLESTKGDVTVKSAGKLVEESKADLTLKAGMNLKSEASVNYEIKGGANCKVEGGAMVKVQGAMVQIN
ncbi:MAG TPA: phage baseplate assembly protein V [Acidobacteriota bacterium]|nr:phage baseplate assembly protein V [Acidobacteriota bacterium]